ncbi:hypothetical protein NP233_g5078 [Leucocoprinus birnbaumii]|uniref:Antifreeze protein n=1 Tax=Leucocoprinus birnbaumii TaxID=56174 RepID=A0AAD5VVU4_9AGAR|nr:hypothetical protein NP233_g5078 [Leucocoprinus birnbaumii]
MLRFFVLALSLTTVFGTPGLLPRDEAIQLTGYPFTAITLSATPIPPAMSKHLTGLFPSDMVAAMLSILKLAGSIATMENGAPPSPIPGARKTVTVLGTLPATALAAEYHHG